MKSSTKTLVLLDAHAVIHRAYHALPDLRTKKGEPTGGLYGIVSMLIRIISDLKPDYLAACYDMPKPTFRKQIYEGYKAGRPKADADLVAQIIKSRDIFESFGIPIYEKEGFEADDILGTIAEKLKKEKDINVIIASGDMDTLQIVDGKKTRVYTLRKGLSDAIIYDEEKVKERFGFLPKFLPDFKGLSGDPSDNIVGVEGIGEKTATELITRFGSIEEIYDIVRQNEEKMREMGIRERVINLLKEGEEEALFSKALATIRRDAPVDFHLPENNWKKNINEEKLENLFDELEFESLKRRTKILIGGHKEIMREDEYEESDEYKKKAIALWLIDSTKTNSPPAEVNNEKLPELVKKLKERDLLKVYEDIELPLIPIIKKAEGRGVLIEVEHLKKLSAQYHKELSVIEKKIHKMAGTEFNVNSPKQISEIIFGAMSISSKGIGKTRGGAISTRESELGKIKDEHPIIKEILNHRELQKLLSTYIDAIPALVDGKNRLHAKLNQTGTTTGRMSSDSPNLQNIPTGEKYGKAIREAFTVAPGHKWISCDYSQIEMRVLAIMSKDDELMKIFKEENDVHASVASRVFAVAENEVNKEMRRRAKVINFGIIYGMGVQALRKNLGTDLKEAKEFHEQYFQMFPRIGIFFEGVKEYARKNGYTKTLFGRRRYFPDIRSKLPQVRAGAERMAMNAPLQGTAADLIKIAMKKAENNLGKAGLLPKAHFILQVHDELVYEVEENCAEEAADIIKKAMENAAALPIPLLANVAIGENWAEAK